jgi:predicted nuclease of predicted toxin-antitoxin system
VKGLLLDQGLPRSAATLLRGAGHEAIHVGELGMSAATDESILAHARKEEFAIVTLDADFHALLALTGAPTRRFAGEQVFMPFGTLLRRSKRLFPRPPV